MPRSNGYRPKKAVKEEVNYWRAKLSECDSSQWQKAGMIMDNITGLLEADLGPSRGKINPRACRYCGFYGHTRQWCDVKKAADEAALDRMIRDGQNDLRKLREAHAVPTEPYDPAKGGQAREFDRLGMPWFLHESCGPIVGAPGQVHGGKWTFDESGYVVAN